MPDPLSQYVKMEDLVSIWEAAQAGEDNLDKVISYFSSEVGIDAWFEVILNEKSQSLFDSFGEYDESFRRPTSEWICSFCSGASGELSKPHFYKDPQVIKFITFRRLIRDHVVNHIEEKILQGTLAGRMPAAGIVLYFTRKVDRSYIIQYQRVQQSIIIEFVEEIVNPQAIFDISDISELQSPRAKNVAKTFMQSGHKVVIHNGILTHVDRRRHYGVFGPTIDTLILSNCVNELRDVRSFESVLEIGVGSGHILNSVLSGHDNFKYACGIDINHQSVFCTHENYERLNSAPERAERDIDFIIGTYSTDKFGRKFDLVLCNPPYIMVPDGLSPNSAGSAYAEAVSGTNLIKEILKSLDTILSKNGIAVLMISSVTSGFEGLVPEGFECAIIDQGTREVPFDIDTLYGEPEWLGYLLEKELVTTQNGMMYHYLKPLILRRADKNASSTAIS